MAPRDYKKRGPAAKKKPVKTVEKKPLGIKVMILGVVASIAVLTLVYGLYSIKGSAEKQVPPPNKTTHNEDEALPEIPAEKWQYIDELKNKQVDVEVAKREKPSKPYQMQCASFRKNDPAQSMKAQIAFLGIESQVRITEGKNGKWYRVVLGPYETKRDAERDRHRLQNKRINGCQIWHWNW